jgi:ribosome-associated protein
MRHTPHKQNTPDAEEDTGPSKTQRKEAMHALQEIGKQLIELPDERLKKVPLSESLRDAVLAARKITAHEARRRQLQYVGRLMRDVDAAPIAAALAAFEKTSDEEKARQHRLEKLLTSLAQEHPHANLQLLRQLRRNTLKEREAGKPPAAYRQLFKELKSLQAESTTMPPAESSDE